MAEAQDTAPELDPALVGRWIQADAERRELHAPACWCRNCQRARAAELPPEPRPGAEAPAR